MVKLLKSYTGTYTMIDLINYVSSMGTFELVGWVGAILLAGCGVPQALLCFKQGHSRGISSMFLWMWFLGEIFTFSYIIYSKGGWPLIVNYTANTIMVLLILRYKYFPNKKKMFVEKLSEKGCCGGNCSCNCGRNNGDSGS